MPSRMGDDQSRATSYGSVRATIAVARLPRTVTERTWSTYSRPRARRCGSVALFFFFFFFFFKKKGGKKKKKKVVTRYT